MKNETKRHKRLAKQKEQRKDYIKKRNIKRNRQAPYYNEEEAIVRPVMGKDGRQEMKAEQIVFSKQIVKEGDERKVIEQHSTIKVGVFEKVGTRQLVRKGQRVRAYAGDGFLPPSRKFRPSKKRLQEERTQQIKQASIQTATK